MAKNNKPNTKPALTDVTDRKKFKTTLATITHHLQTIDDQKEAIKEIVTELSASSGIDKKVIRKLAMTMYKHNYSTLQEENKHFESLYETVIEGKLVDDELPGEDKKAA